MSGWEGNLKPGGAIHWVNIKIVKIFDDFPHLSGKPSICFPYSAIPNRPIRMQVSVSVGLQNWFRFPVRK